MTEEVRWIPLKDFCLLYGIAHSTVRARAKTGELHLLRQGNRRVWVMDPGWSQAPPQAKDNIGKENVHMIRGVEVAKILGVSPRAVRYMSQEAKLSDFRTGTVPMSKRRYSIADVRQMLAMRETKKYQKRKRGSAVRAAVLAWALEQLKNPAP